MREKIGAIQSLLAAAKEENEFGGGEDVEGCLHPGDVNWDELEERIICVLEDRPWSPPKPKPVYPHVVDVEVEEWVDLSNLPVEE